jgi:hypothetical protein
MRRIYIAMCCLWAGISGVCAQDNTNKVRITLRQAIQIAQLQSVDAAVAPIGNSVRIGRISCRK